jgi:hypothetical protein
LKNVDSKVGKYTCSYQRRRNSRLFKKAMRAKNKEELADAAGYLTSMVFFFKIQNFCFILNV